MPIDKMISDAMLETFRNMVNECKSQNLLGENFDKMCEKLNRMEQLAEELDDINAFNAQLMQENLFASFSDHYSRALSEQAQQSTQNDGTYNDAALLKQSIDALKHAINANRDSYQEALNTTKSYDPEKEGEKAYQMAANMGLEITEEMKRQNKQELSETLKKTPNAFNNSAEIEVLQNPEDLIKPIQDLIVLGEKEGMTFPKFLRLQIERGLDKAMEGAIVARKALLTEQEFTMAGPTSPYHIQKIEKKIEAFDTLASKQKFNVPNWKELNLQYDKIDRAFEPDIIKFSKITFMWEKLIYDLSFWSLSYCSFAPNIEPWNLSKNPEEAVIRSQKTRPGIFSERVKLSEKYFGMGFPEILEHETFQWAVEYNYISYSQEYIHFLLEMVLPQCEPFNDLSGEIINTKETLYKSRKESNPLSHMPAQKMQEFYDKKFGTARYESKYGPITKNDSTASAWNTIRPN